MCVQRDPDDEQLACQYSRRVKDVRVMYAVAPDARSGKNVPVARHRHAGRPRLPVGNVLQARSPAGPSNFGLLLAHAQWQEQKPSMLCHPGDEPEAFGRRGTPVSLRQRRLPQRCGQPDVCSAREPAVGDAAIA
jgi:hypothetical protein